MNTELGKRNRNKLICNDVSLTDQSFKKRCDVNKIVAQYKKTGVLAQPTAYKGYFADFSEVPSLEDAFEAVKRASERFQSLPAEVRLLMSNDPSKLEIWLSDSQNLELAQKHGLIEKKIVEPDEIIPPTGGNNVNNGSDISGGSNASANS